MQAVAVLGLTGFGVALMAAPVVAGPSMAENGVNITTDGRNVGAPESGTSTLLGSAHRSGVRGELLVGNYSEALGDCDQAAAHRMLTKAVNRRRVERRPRTVVR